MVVEINLLEQKEKRNVLPYLIGAFFMLFIIILTITFSLQKAQLNQQVETLDGQIERLQLEQESYSGPVEGAGTDREHLRNSLDQLKGTIVPVIPIVQGLVELLPERGFFESFALTGKSEVTVNVRFDTIQEAAEYTNTLIQQPFVKEVELTGVESDEVDEENLYEYHPRYMASYYISLEESKITSEGVATE